MKTISLSLFILCTVVYNHSHISAVKNDKLLIVTDIKSLISRRSTPTFSTSSGTERTTDLHKVGVNAPYSQPSIKLPSFRDKPYFRSRLRNSLAYITSRFEKDLLKDGSVWIDYNPKQTSKRSKNFPQASYEVGDDIYELDDEDEEYSDNSSSGMKRRIQFWNRPSSDGTSVTPSKDNGDSHDHDNEHPMRTDEWLIRVTLSPFLNTKRLRSEGMLFPQSDIKKNREENNNTRVYSTNNTPSMRKKEQIMIFSRTGYVLLLESSAQRTHENTMDSNNCDLHQLQTSRRITTVGKWHIDATGVSWDIPVHILDYNSNTYNNNNNSINNSRICVDNHPEKYRMTQSKEIDDYGDDVDSDLSDETIQSFSNMKSTVLHYHADIHLSKFQERPRMFKGVITRDHFHETVLPIKLFGQTQQLLFRKNLFRPVVATFTAEGIGEDTVDFSYKKRGFGLNGNSIGNK
jgi:hypothetical protein